MQWKPGAWKPRADTSYRDARDCESLKARIGQTLGGLAILCFAAHFVSYHVYDAVGAVHPSAAYPDLLNLHGKMRYISEQRYDLLWGEMSAFIVLMAAAGLVEYSIRRDIEIRQTRARTGD